MLFFRAGEGLRGEPTDIGGQGQAAGRPGGQDERHPQRHQQADTDLQHLPVTPV